VSEKRYGHGKTLNEGKADNHLWKRLRRKLEEKQKSSEVQISLLTRSRNRGLPGFEDGRKYPLKESK